MTRHPTAAAGDAGPSAKFTAGGASAGRYPSRPRDARACIARLFVSLFALGAAACTSSTAKKVPAAPVWTASDLGPGRCLAINTAGQIIGVDDDDGTFIVTA